MQDDITYKTSIMSSLLSVVTCSYTTQQQTLHGNRVTKGMLHNLCKNKLCLIILHTRVEHLPLNSASKNLALGSEIPRNFPTESVRSISQRLRLYSARYSVHVVGLDLVLFMRIKRPSKSKFELYSTCFVLTVVTN